MGLANKSFREMMFPGNVAPLSFNGILLRYWPQGVKQIAPVLQCQLDEIILIVKNSGGLIHGIILLILMMDLLFVFIKMVQ